MNCKYCNEELVEGKPFCPACGKTQESTEETAPVQETPEAVEVAVSEEMVPEDNAAAEEAAAEENAEAAPCAEETRNGEPAAEEQTKTKASAGKIALVVVAVIALAAILLALILGGKNDGDQVQTPTVAPTEATEPVVIPSDADPASFQCKSSYSVSDAEAEAAADVVVATMGDKVLTNGQLQAYYWQEVYLFLQEYGSYASYIGLDLYTPLDEQLTDLGQVPMSWQQFFLDCAIYTWKNYQSMALEAESCDYRLPEDLQEEVDNLGTDLLEVAVNNGFETADELVKFNVGAGCSLAHYRDYVNVYYHGQSYYYDYCENIAPTQEEIEAYYAENAELFEANGITKDTKYIDVRHVLLQPEGGETGEDGFPVFTDEAWADCLAKAEQIYAQWQEGDMTEESFAQLAKDHSEDGNAATGGLYENVAEGQMVTAYNDWCFDENRQIGDHGLVKTQFGYHIMYFSGSRQAYYVNAENNLINELAYDFIPAMIEKYPAEVDFSAIVLSEVKMY